MIKWMISNPWLVLGITLCLLGSAAWLYGKGRNDGIEYQKGRQALANEKAVDTREAIQIKNNRLPKGEANNRLRKDWCLDC